MQCGSVEREVKRAYKNVKCRMCVKGLRSLRIFKKLIFFLTFSKSIPFQKCCLKISSKSEHIQRRCTNLTESNLNKLNKLNKSPPMRFLLQKKGHFIVLESLTRCNYSIFSLGVYCIICIKYFFYWTVYLYSKKNI